MPLFVEQRDKLEAQWVAEHPDAQAAWNEASGLLEEWTRTVQARHVVDTRPLYVRCYWSRRDLCARENK
jgi:hypothetical protein